MTIASTETQLLLLAAFFYVYDASALLFSNEALLTPTWGGRWVIVYQPNGITFRGRTLYIPNLWLPHRPVFRLFWATESVNFDDEEDWAARKAKYGKLVPLVYGAAASIFILLPLCLFVGRTDVYVLGAALIIYLQAFASAVTVLGGRDRFDLDRKAAWSTAIEFVLCPPLAINLIRRLSLSERIKTSLPAAGINLLDSDDWERLKSRLLQQQDAELDDAATDEARGALEQAKLKISARRKEP